MSRNSTHVLSLVCRFLSAKRMRFRFRLGQALLSLHVEPFSGRHALPRDTTCFCFHVTRSSHLSSRHPCTSCHVLAKYPQSYGGLSTLVTWLWISGYKSKHRVHSSKVYRKDYRTTRLAARLIMKDWPQHKGRI